MFWQGKTGFHPKICAKSKRKASTPISAIPKIVEIEEKYGLRSTFFFRPKYDDGTKWKNTGKPCGLFRRADGK